MPQLEGHGKVYQGDRCKGGGGAAVFARVDVATRVTLVSESPDERCWVTIHSDEGPYLACCWYRPPKQGEIASIVRFKEELLKLRSTGVGTIIIGDINVHCKRWLRHSHSNSAEGECLYNVCSEMGLKQLIREPTRDDYLLDLVMTDIPNVACETGSKIADHRYVIARFTGRVPTTVAVQRTVWNYGRADWQLLQDRLDAHDWNFLREITRI